MADIISVDFRKKKRIEKYTVRKSICVICLNNVIFDSRKTEENEPYIELPKTKGQCICKWCAVKVKEVVDENEWE